MNTSVTSKEAILETCRNLVSANGLDHLNMRAVAQACGVALGSLYYYFPSKDDLLLATIESVWEDIFHLQEEEKEDYSFPNFIAQCYTHLQIGIEKYPHFFSVHALSVSAKEKNRAHASMERYLAQIQEKMHKVLHADPDVCTNAFSEKFTETAFFDFLVANLVSLLVQGRGDCRVLLEVIRRTIY